MTRFAESVVEEAALAWLQGLDYAVLHGPDIAAGEPGAERRDPGYRDVVLERRLRDALARLNPELPADAQEDAFRKLACGLFHGFDWRAWITGTPQARLSLLPAAQEHILALEDGKSRLLRAVTELSQAFAPAPSERAGL